MNIAIRAALAAALLTGTALSAYAQTSSTVGTGALQRVAEHPAAPLAPAAALPAVRIVRLAPIAAPDPHRRLVPAAPLPAAAPPAAPWAPAVRPQAPAAVRAPPRRLVPVARLPVTGSLAVLSEPAVRLRDQVVGLVRRPRSEPVAPRLAAASPQARSVLAGVRREHPATIMAKAKKGALLAKPKTTAVPANHQWAEAIALPFSLQEDRV